VGAIIVCNISPGVNFSSLVDIHYDAMNSRSACMPTAGARRPAALPNPAPHRLVGGGTPCPPLPRPPAGDRERGRQRQGKETDRDRQRQTETDRDRDRDRRDRQTDRHTHRTNLTTRSVCLLQIIPERR
jgi:hypothetical protein